MLKRSTILACVLAVSGGLAAFWSRQVQVPDVVDAGVPRLAAQPSIQLTGPPEPVRLEAESTRATTAPPVYAAQMQALLGRFATGDFLGALKLADEYALDPSLGDSFQQWLSVQMPVLLTSAGWTHLKVGACDEAIALLRRAEVLKRSEDTAKGLGVCHYKLRQMSAARDQLSWYLERRPEDLQVPMLLADTLESEGRYEEAVQVLERLQKAPCDAGKAGAEGYACPSTQGLEQRLASMRGRAREGLLQQRDYSRSFRLVYRAGDHEDLVAYVLQELEDALDEYIENYGFRLPPSPIEVALYPADHFQHIVVGGPEWAEGLYDGRIRIPVRSETLRSKSFEDLRIVLRHELVHALFSAMNDHRNMPPWLDEGLAQVLSCQPNCAVFAFAPQPGGFLEPASFQSSYISFSPLKAGRAYRQSLYLVLTLMQRAGDDIVRQIVSSVTATSDLSSDHLLAPAAINFRDLHSYAASLWERRLPL